jgi:SAM-dependent methyltransferase
LSERPEAPFESPPVGDDGIARALADGEPAMICEAPDLFGTRQAGRPLEVTGWAWSPVGIEAVWVTIDRRVRARAVHGLVRPDLWSLHEGELGTAGFAFRADPRDWAPGSHELSVVAVTCDGRAVGVSGSIEAVEATPTKGDPSGAIDPLPDRISTDPWRQPLGATIRVVAEALRDDSPPASARPESDALFVADVHRDPSVAPEHHARYRWAAPLVASARVLDAGCATGWSTALLAGHARHATGIDSSPQAIAEAERNHGGAATFRQADLTRLPFDDDEFDAVVCFEAIERVAEPGRALDELRRVLRPDGLLLISCANRNVYPPGNPLHVHMYAPDELEAALCERFASVAIHRQQTYLASLLCANEILEARDPARPIRSEVAKAIAQAPGEELYTVAAATATDAMLPPPPNHLALGTATDGDWERLIRHWQQRAIHAETQAATIRTDAHHAYLAQRDAAERTAAKEAELAGRLSALDGERVDARAAADRLEALENSLSWRITRPLRSIKREILRVKSLVSA